MKAAQKLALLAAALVCGAAWAQVPAAAAAPASAASVAQQATFVDALLRIGQADLSVPASPAFAVLGITPTGIQRPGTVRELTTALIKGFDSAGKPKTGLALDIAPLPVFAQELIVGGKKYEADTLIQVLARTTVSLATVDAADGASQQAWGVRVGLIDRGDPGLYSDELISCVKGNVRLPDIVATPDVNPLPAQANDELRKAIAACDPTKRIALWAKPALYVGFGQSWFSATGALKDRTAATRAFWGTYSVGRELGEMRALLQLHVQKNSNARVVDPTDATRFVRQDSSNAVARLAMGKSKWHAFVDLGAGRMKQASSGSTSTRHQGIGAEFQIRADTWLQMGHVSEHGSVDGSNQRKVTAGIRFGSEPFLKQPGPAP